MIFPATMVRELLRKYYDTGDPTGSVAAEIHRLSDDFIKTIALSVNTLYVDDLMQVGHLKLQEIMVDHRFDLERGSSLYSFVWHTLKNAMISWCRREPDPCEDVDEVDIEDEVTLDARDYEDVRDFITLYGPLRFPDLQQDVARDACIYAYEAIAEIVKERWRGAKRTIISEYSLDYPQADLIVSSVLAVMRMIMLRIDVVGNMPFALAAIENGATGLIPEMYLFLGKDGEDFFSTFGGLIDWDKWIIQQLQVEPGS